MVNGFGSQIFGPPRKNCPAITSVYRTSTPRHQLGKGGFFLASEVGWKVALV